MEWPFSTRQVLELLGYNIPTNNTHIYIQCPYCHDKKKHMNINLIKNKYRCNLCGESGNTLQFYRDLTGLHDCKEAYWDIMEHLNLKTESREVLNIRRERVREEQQKIHTVPVLSPEKLHKVYQNLLNLLTLDEDHMRDLINRGLSQNEIKNLGYKTYTNATMNEVVLKLQNMELELIGVPGFFRYHNTIQFKKEKRGILVPYRSFNGYIIGLQLRIDEVERDIEEDGKKSTKYKWISSKDLYDGCGTSSIHYACEFGWDEKTEEFYPLYGKNKTIYLTEGGMKADIAHFLSDYKLPFIAVAGVNHFTKLEDELLRLKEYGVEKIVNMYDMDYLTNPNVQKAMIKTKEMIITCGLKYQRYVWNPSYKGIDDYLKYRKSVH